MCTNYLKLSIVPTIFEIRSLRLSSSSKSQGWEMVELRLGTELRRGTKLSDSRDEFLKHNGLNWVKPAKDILSYLHYCRFYTCGFLFFICLRGMGGNGKRGN